MARRWYSMSKKDKKYDIFISYRRDGGEFTAKILRDRLEALGYKVFFDLETLRSGDFNKKLYDVIDECEDFLLVLSPNALDRCINEGDWVRHEVEWALQKEKNIVPILLRGFSFPETLPASMEPIRFKSGLEANTQLFDAFIETLCEYLVSAPDTSAPPSRRRLLAAAALVLAVLAGGIAASWALGLWNRSFPKTAVEKSVASEVIYYMETHLTELDIIAGAADDAMQEARRYLITGSSAFSSLEDAFEISLHTIAACDVESCAPTDGLIQRVGELRDTPFSTAEIIAMHDVMILTRNEWIGNLSYILQMAGPDSYLPANTSLNILDFYQAYLEEDLKWNAYNANEFLLPVTNRSVLSDFFNIYLPRLQNIPLSSSTWIDDAEMLTAAEAAVDNSITEILMKRSALVGNMTMDTAAMRESILRVYETLGMTRKEAEQLFEDWMELQGMRMEYDELLQQLRPDEDDGWDVLWLKLQSLVDNGRYDYALECVDMLEILMEGDPDAALYLPALRLFLNSVDQTGIAYGAMVMAWVDPETPNEMYRIGDVIVALNGEACRDIQEYADRKAAVTEDTFAVTVLRAGGAGRLETVELEMTSEMPQVYLMNMTFADGEA